MQPIEQRFKELCKEYALHAEAICDTYESDAAKCVYQIVLHQIKVEFCFYKKARTFILPHTLFCRIYLQKNSVVYYHLPDLLAEIQPQDFRAGYFSFIESPQRMENCFGQLADILNSHMQDIVGLFSRMEEIREKLFATYKGMYKLKDDSVDFSEADDEDSYTHGYFCNMQGLREEYVIGRFTSMEAYTCFLCGDTEKARRLYEKVSRKQYMFPYEQRLIAFLSTPACEDFSPMPEACFSQKEGQKIDTLTGTDLLKIFGIALLLFGSVFCLAFGITNAVLAHGSVFFFSVPWYFGFVFSGLCAIFGGIAFRRHIRRLYDKESRTTTPEMQAIATSKAAEIFAKTVFALALAFSIFGSVMILGSFVRFDAETFSYNQSDSLICIDPVTYRYADISGVYYIEARYNVYGDRIERPSYVILLRDGGSLDLDGCTSVKVSEMTVIPFLKEKGFTVVTLDSDRDLPQQ